MNQIKIETTINANLEKVWDGYTNPESIVRWNFASDDWHCPSAKVDLRVGGMFSSRMESKDGKMGFDFGGVYTRIVEEENISYKMDDGRNAEVIFEALADATKVTVNFDPESQNSLELQREGWQSILDNFKTYVESLK